MSDPSWELLRSFALVAKAGGVSAAARESNLSQPSLSRHIAELEQQLGLQLFDRAARGVRLTPYGEQLWARARLVQEQVDAFMRVATGLSEQTEGVVRISAPELISAYLLPRWLALFHQEHPQVRLEWVVDNMASNLLEREADVAVRMYPSEQLDLVARQAGQIRWRFYASKDYLSRYGQPDSAHPEQARWVGDDKDGRFVRMARRVGVQFEREWFAFCSDDYAAQRAAVRAGLGVGVFSYHATRDWDDDVVEVLLEDELPASTVWVVAHQEVHHNVRMRLVFEHLYGYIKGHVIER